MRKWTLKFARAYSVVDNLFVVESPLQALIALELNLRFKGQKNGIVYRFSKGRERNNNQIEKVINGVKWSFQKKISFNDKNPLLNHQRIAKELKGLRRTFPTGIKQLFIGEFRTQWMHFMRVATKPTRTILMDDGAATVTVKRRFIDKGVYYPKDILERGSFLKKLVKRYMYRDFIKSETLYLPMYLASAFIKEGSLYPIDFSFTKQLFSAARKTTGSKAVFYFGSKYSEAGIISRDYELELLNRIKQFYSSYNCDLLYCAHRDESKEKLNIIENTLGFHVLSPTMPAEIFLLENNERIHEISGAYSSILNNAKTLMPELSVRAFKLVANEVNAKNRAEIEYIYDHFKAAGITVCGF